MRIPALVELLDDLRVGVVGGESLDQLDHLRWGALGVGRLGRPLNGVLLGGARAPADPDLQLTVSGWEVSVTSTIIARSSRLRSRWAVVSAAHSFGRSRASASRCSREGSGARLVLLGELGLGFGELAQLLLPARLEAAGDEPVVRLAGVERALGADRLIPGALDAQLDRAGRARAAVRDLVGSGERQLDLPRRESPRAPGRRPARRRPSS